VFLNQRNLDNFLTEILNMQISRDSNFQILSKKSQ
jgi:hypothetical protein